MVLLLHKRLIITNHHNMLGTAAVSERYLTLAQILVSTHIPDGLVNHNNPKISEKAHSLTTTPYLELHTLVQILVSTHIPDGLVSYNGLIITEKAHTLTTTPYLELQQLVNIMC